MNKDSRQGFCLNRMSWEVFLPLLFLGEEFVKVWCQFFFKCLIAFTNEAIQVPAFLVGSFKITNSISLFAIDIFIFSIFLKILYICIQRDGKGGRKKERNIDVSEIHQLVASLTPQLGSWLSTPACALTRSGTSVLLVSRPVVKSVQ